MARCFLLYPLFLDALYGFSWEVWKYMHRENLLKIPAGLHTKKAPALRQGFWEDTCQQSVTAVFAFFVLFLFGQMVLLNIRFDEFETAAIAKFLPKICNFISRPETYMQNTLVYIRTVNESPLLIFLHQPHCLSFFRVSEISGWNCLYGYPFLITVWTQ